MRSRYSDQINQRMPLEEYPRPQMVRDSYLNLNGVWECAFTGMKTKKPSAFPLKILVPFSPESELSGIGRTLRPKELLWYRRTFDLQELMDRSAGYTESDLAAVQAEGGQTELQRRRHRTARCLLHFGAVDQKTRVWVNGNAVGTHIGGFTAFTLDVTPYLRVGRNEIIVCVRDLTDTGWQSRGKQKLKPGGIWYTPQSGIWQTVWMELVPESYIRSLAIRPLFRQGRLEVTVNTTTDLPVRVTAFIEDKETEIRIPAEIHGRSGERLELILPHGWKPWSPEEPVLYDLEVQAGNDRVRSYFGMREFAVHTDESGIPRMFLNGRPYFRTGVLDQGYYSDGLLTPPCEQAMIDDIQLMKDMGFNVLRKHIKIEPMRWYYHCDRLGMLVWQDMINGGSSYDTALISAPVAIPGLHRKDDAYRLFGRKSDMGRLQYYAELYEMLEQLGNVVSLELWTPFNEGWGQFDAAKTARMIREADPTRFIDHASGWYDQGIGEFKSLHVYFRPYKFHPDVRDRAVILSEFGGYSCRIEGHCCSKKSFGYRGYRSMRKLQEGFLKLYEEQILPAVPEGLCAAIYTQLSDVEDEVNGFITYDRSVVKYDVKTIREMNNRLKKLLG